MLARAHTFTIEGLQTRHVIVEVDIRAGLPGVRDRRPRGRGRARGARARAGGDPQLRATSFPPGASPRTSRPGDVPKAGPGLDLALACAVLAASGQLPPRAAGEPRRCSGSSRSTAPVRACHGARSRWRRRRSEAGLGTLVLAGASARARRSWSRPARWRPSSACSSAVRVLSGGARRSRCPHLPERLPSEQLRMRSKRGLAPAGPERGARPAPRGEGARDRRGRAATTAC